MRLDMSDFEVLDKMTRMSEFVNYFRRLIYNHSYFTDPHSPLVLYCPMDAAIVTYFLTGHFTNIYPRNLPSYASVHHIKDNRTLANQHEWFG